MSFADDEINELVAAYGQIQSAVEAGVTYILIPTVTLPAGCTPAVVDALLCPSARDGYESRLFLSEKVTCNQSGNWNASDIRILERNWFAVSWRVPGGLRLLQMVGVHLRAFR